MSGVFVCRRLSKCWLVLLEFDATLDAECGFLDNLYSLGEVKGLQVCSKTLKMDI